MSTTAFVLAKAVKEAAEMKRAARREMDLFMTLSFWGWLLFVDRANMGADPRLKNDACARPVMTIVMFDA